jgi:hypothetical protein
MDRDKFEAEGPRTLIDNKDKKEVNWKDDAFGGVENGPVVYDKEDLYDSDSHDDDTDWKDEAFNPKD